MSSMESVSAEDIASLLGRLDIHLSESERPGAADRLKKLADIYEELDAAPADRLAGRPPARELFETGRRRPGPDEDPYNAWLTRFDLSRPELSGSLEGLSVAIKDNICVRGVELTCGSRAFEGVVPEEHAAVVDRLLGAGARIVGKTNMDELAFGPTSETSAFGPTENPAVPGHVTGGSSAGSAAAVAAGDVDLALGSDTGGSVRIPASYCGIVGMKPTFGLVPLRGVVPMAPSMDHVGPLARDVETVTRGLAAIADPGPDGEPAVDRASLGTDPDALTIGLAPGFFEGHTTDEVADVVRDAVDDLSDAGAMVKAVEIPALEYSRPAWWGIAPLEFAAVFSTNAVGLWQRGRPVHSLASAIARVRRASGGALGPNPTEMLALGQYLNHVRSGRDYVRARDLRTSLTTHIDDVFTEVDLLAAPGTPTTALEIDGFERGVTPPVNWVTHPTNLTGHPSISLPCGEVDGLPVGLQFIGPAGSDQEVLDAAYTYEGMQ